MFVFTFMNAPLHFLLMFFSGVMKPIFFMDKLLSTMITLDNVVMMIMTGMFYQIIICCKLDITLITLEFLFKKIQQQQETVTVY